MGASIGIGIEVGKKTLAPFAECTERVPVTIAGRCSSRCLTFVEMIVWEPLEIFWRKFGEFECVCVYI